MKNSRFPDLQHILGATRQTEQPFLQEWTVMELEQQVSGCTRRQLDVWHEVHIELIGKQHLRISGCRSQTLSAHWMLYLHAVLSVPPLFRMIHAASCLF